MLLAFSVAPVGMGESVSPAVAAAIRVVEASGLSYQLGSMFTTIEGTWDEVFDVVRQACDAVAEYSGRISLVMKADIRPGHTGELIAKVDRVRALLDEEIDGS